MAARPNKASAGRDPFADLLFSPRASFIWDHTTCAITWMNAAARSKFGLDAKKAQAALPAGVAARLAEGFDAANANGKTSGTVRFKAGRHPAIPCTFEVMELAGGHKGLIVSEAAATQEPANVLRLPTPPKKKTVAKPSGKQPAAQTKRQPAPSNPAAPISQLTPEELRAFKAIGRTVRRLAREKQRRASAVPKASAAEPPPQALPGADMQGTSALLFSAFDLVLFLDRDFVISRTEGRPQQIGCRKSDLLGKPAANVLLPAEQAIFSPYGQEAERRRQSLPRHAGALGQGRRQRALPRGPQPLAGRQRSLFPCFAFTEPTRAPEALPSLSANSQARGIATSATPRIQSLLTALLSSLNALMLRCSMKPRGFLLQAYKLFHR